MFPFLRRHMLLLSLWILLSATLLLANPWGRFGWVELVAVVGPLILGLDRRIHREIAFAVGLPVIALLGVMDPASTVVPRLFVAWSVFAIGVFLAARVIESHAALESIAGHVAFAPPDARAFTQFKTTLEREFGRARRHDRAFALLSVAVHPHSIPVDESSGHSSELLRALAENRARLEVHDLLARELHVYADVVAARGRVLALVPETEGAALDALLDRIQDVVSDSLAFEVQVGVGCFPRDAISVDELILAADRDRTNSRLRRLPDRSGDLELDEPEDLAREVLS